HGRLSDINGSFGRASGGMARSCRRPCNGLTAMSGGFNVAATADRYSAERVIEPLSVKLLLSHGFVGLALAGTLVIGGAGNRGEIVEIRTQSLAPGPDRGRVPPFGKAFGAAGSGIESGAA